MPDARNKMNVVGEYRMGLLFGTKNGNHLLLFNSLKTSYFCINQLKSQFWANHTKTSLCTVYIKILPTNFVLTTKFFTANILMYGQSITKCVLDEFAVFLFVSV